MFRIIFIFLFFTSQAHASSCMYQDVISGQHYNKINMASGDEAEPLAKARCEERAGGRRKV